MSDSSKAFLANVLRIEILSPAQPHLTIINFLSLIYLENKLQSAANIQII